MPHAKTLGRSYYFEKEEIFVKEMAVLVAVSIPIFTRQLEKSREATDKANLRAAKAAVVTAMLDDVSTTSGETYYYDAAAGIITTSEPAGYGKGTSVTGDAKNSADGYDAARGYTDAYLVVSITEDETNGVVGTLTWTGAKGDKAINGDAAVVKVGGKDAFSTTATTPTP